MLQQRRLVFAASTALPLLIAAQTTIAIDVPNDARAFGLDSLATVPVPEPVNLADFVKNRQAAIELGKALFWDMQAGSDGQACASCHFHAGADSRVKNQLNPGLPGVIDPTGVANPDKHFGNPNVNDQITSVTASGAVPGPNYTLNGLDFPFHQLVDELDRNSAIIYTTNDITSSQGTFGAPFIAVPNQRAAATDTCGAPSGDVFNSGGVPVRKVEPRNTPTMINAVFNHRNFWDGRANNIFNGLNPLGLRGNLPTAQDTNPGILVMGAGERVTTVAVAIDNASLASQAVGPPLSDFEMSCAGRVFPDLGKKLMKRRALGTQDVAVNDSVLGGVRNTTGQGLRFTYEQMIRRAFHERYWKKELNAEAYNAVGDVVPRGAQDFLQTTPGVYSQMEVNFSLFWGLAIQMYEATLVSSKAPFDVWMEANVNTAFTPVAGFGAQELAGLNVFTAQGRCIVCHFGPEFTAATLRAAVLPGVPPLPNGIGIERMFMVDGGAALYDVGFYNIGVTPSVNDHGIGANLGGFPLSFSRQVATGAIIDNIAFDPALFQVPGPIVLGERVDVDGAFKAPSVRNAELTGPYFHNGSYASLEQLVDFYNRGGNRRDVPCTGLGSVNGIGDTTGFGDTCTNTPPDMALLGLTAVDKAALIAFIKSLTDPRVRINAAPFDRPQLTIPNGHPGDQVSTVADTTGKAVDDVIILPATGAAGGADIGTFLGL